jgi:hypothetical protein
MRLFALALSLGVALVLAATGTAAAPTTAFTGSPQFHSQISADLIHRDVSLTVTFTHRSKVEVQVTPIVNGVVGCPQTATFRGTGGDTLTASWSGADAGIGANDEVLFSLQLSRLHGLHPTGAVVTITSQTFHA